MQPLPVTPGVVLPGPARAALVVMAKAHTPREAVALLGGECSGDAVVVTDVEPLPNVAADRDHFTIVPHVFARAEAALRARGRTWLGFAHSHPGGSASPSCTDRAELWRGCLQLIVAGDDVRAFRFDDAGTCVAVPLVTDAAAAPATAAP